MYLNPRIIARICHMRDEYTHVPLARRVFLRRLAKLAGGAAAAAALLPLLENAYADQVRRDDERARDRQDRLRRLLLGWRHGEPARGACRQARRSRLLLRRGA